jgi:hypothetical protein
MYNGDGTCKNEDLILLLTGKSKENNKAHLLATTRKRTFEQLTFCSRAVGTLNIPVLTVKECTEYLKKYSS